MRLTVLGFLFSSVLSFQRRFVELGMLRAIGLSVRQLGAVLAWEQALIISLELRIENHHSISLEENLCKPV
jgi:hypothetical protein